MTSQKGLILEFYQKNPLRNIEHPEVVDWATREYKKRTGNIFRDPDRAIRYLHQQGYLIKVSKGVYRYDPKAVKQRQLEDFSEAQKQAILKRDSFKCVICGLGKKEGEELHVDHIKPKDKGGKAVIENGQTLCGKHNYRKKNYQQTETGKRMFIRLLKLARKKGDTELMDFCKEILEVYEKNNINGFIKWK